MTINAIPLIGNNMKNTSDLDLEFMLTAEKVTSFNFKPQDFQSTKYKSEIQFLIKKHFFTQFNMSDTVSNISMLNLNSAIKRLKMHDMNKFRMLFKYPLLGSGPGEVLLYFLIDNCHLGGGSSAGVDIITPNKSYEVKAAMVSPKGYVYDFKLGSNFSTADIMKDVANLKKNMGEAGSEINVTTIERIKKKYPDEWAKIEKQYQDITYEKYFKHHDIIFMTNNPTTKLGDVVAIKTVNKSDISIERITSGVIKPRVKI